MTIFTSHFDHFVSMLRLIAESVEAHQKRQEANDRIEQKRQEMLRDIEEGIAKDAESILVSERVPTSMWPTERVPIEQDLRAQRSKFQPEKLNRIRDQETQAIQPHIDLLSAIEECETQWAVTLKAIELATKALKHFAASSSDLDADAQEAIRRGYRATDAKSAKEAIAQAKRDRAEAEKLREKKLAEEQANRLKEEIDRLQLEVEEQSAAEKLLRSKRAELSKLGGAA